MTGDDAVELGERLHLVDDDAPHLRGAFRGFRGQLQHAAAQLLAGGLELALHLRRHPAHALHDVGEALGRLLEHLVGGGEQDVAHVVRTYRRRPPVYDSLVDLRRALEEVAPEQC